MRILTDIGKQTKIGDIFALVREGAREHGAARHSYHFTPIFQSQISHHTIIDGAGYPPELVAMYQDTSARLHNPIPDFIMERGEPLIWSTVIGEVLARHSDKDIQNFIRLIQKYGVVHGISIPLYGPRNRNAYATFGFDEPVTSVEDDNCLALRAIMQVAHVRICILLNRAIPPIKLSNREAEVLKWISKGKSNNDVARILEISSETVATYVRRVFTKLEVHDRVGATVKALQLGLIKH